MSHAHPHQHGVEAVSDRALLWAVALNVGLSGFEVFAGIVAGSVALLADAAHNLNDCAALAIAYVARRISRRGANERFTFSYRRAELIGAMINLTALVLVGLYLAYEAVDRMLHPQPLSGAWMIAAASVALVVDVATAALLWAMSKGSLNVRAAFVHNLSDALASLAVLAGGGAVLFLGWNWVDPILTLALAGYIVAVSLRLLRRTTGILMEGTPEGLDLRAVQQAVESTPGVDDLHHLHVWELDEQHRALEAHITVAADVIGRIEQIKSRIKQVLETQFSIHHSTLEFEIAGQACGEHDRGLISHHP